MLNSLPIFVVSAFAFKADQEKAMKLGARRYFVKPINLTELVMAIEEELACQYLQQISF
jgi:two-component system cell cycle response regulator DivK